MPRNDPKYDPLAGQPPESFYGDMAISTISDEKDDGGWNDHNRPTSPNLEPATTSSTRGMADAKACGDMGDMGPEGMGGE